MHVYNEATTRLEALRVGANERGACAEAACHIMKSEAIYLESLPERLECIVFPLRDLKCMVRSGA